MSSLTAAASLAARGSGGRSSVSGIAASVFGSTGFLGRYVTNQLGKIGSQITVPYRGDELYSRHLKVMGDLGQVVPVPFELRDDDSIRSAVSGSSVVINLLGKHLETPNYSFHDVHVERTQRLAEIAREEGAEHFVHVSTNVPAKECSSAWLATKREGEAAVLEVFPRATIIRPTDMFGTEDRFLVRMAMNVVQMPVIPLANVGESLVQPVWVNDVASVVAVAARDPEAHAGKVFELGGPDVFTVDECYKYVMEKTRREGRFLPLPATLAQLAQKIVGLRIPLLHPSPNYSADNVKMEVADNVLDMNKEGVVRFEHLDAIALNMESDISAEVLRRFRKGGDRSSLFYVD